MGIQDYTIEEREILNEYLEPYLKPYLSDEDKKLKKMTNEILVKLKYHDVNRDDFVSLAHEIIVKAMYDYDFIQDFDGYIYSCLEKKFKTEMTRLNRQKRQADKLALSLETPIGNEEGGTLEDIVASKSTIEKDVFEDKEEGYSKEMKQYLGRLSKLQKEVLRLISIGYMPSEILEELHINQKLYNDCYNAIHSYKNISILM